MVGNSIGAVLTVFYDFADVCFVTAVTHGRYSLDSVSLLPTSLISAMS